ncbi:MAG: Bax inhibitor-1/YccA family protein [Micrococcales bacterium]|nr:Bax inhibitor-1/YccA family protein [Micrococcales bacterium]
MANSNPAFARNPAFSSSRSVPPVPTPGELQQHLDLPSATPDQMGRMTYEDTIVKTVLCFGILVATAAVGWFVPLLWIVGGIVAFVLALIIIFKRTPSPALVVAYAATEGLFVGGVSQFYADAFGGGIVPMAVLGTLAVVGATLALFASGKVRASRRATRIFLVIMVGYLAFSLVNLLLMATGVVTTGYFGVRSMEIGNTGIPIGVPLGILVILLAAYSLVLDFDSIQQGVRNGAPRVYGWIGAFGILVTVVWLYLEILRLLALLTGRR